MLSNISFFYINKVGTNGIQMNVHLSLSFTYSSSNVSSLRFNLVNFQKKIAYLSMAFAGNGQEAKDSFSAKFHSLPWWFTYDDDCSCMQKGWLKLCRFPLVLFFAPTLCGFCGKKTIEHFLLQVFMTRIGRMRAMLISWTGYWEKSL